MIYWITPVWAGELTSASPPRVKPEISVQKERPAALQAESSAYIWNPPVLSLSRWPRHFCSYHAPVRWIAKGISNQKWISPELFYLIIGQVVCVADGDDALHQKCVDGLFQQKSIGFVVLRNP